MNLKEKMSEKKYLYGTWCIIPSPEVIDIITKAGLDFVLIDMEHGPSSFETVQKMLMAAESNGSNTIIRVATNDESLILKALDIGANGIIVPHIESVDDCEKALSFMKYPPAGKRGFSPYTRAGHYGSNKNLIEEANAKIVTGIIVEGKEGIKNIARIIDNELLNIVYIGTYDISCSLGLAGKTKSLEVLNLLEKCVKTVNDSGKIAGCLFHDPEELAYFKKIGIKLMLYKVDTAVLYEGFSIVNDFKLKEK